jgi:hypothetical protein
MGGGAPVVPTKGEFSLIMQYTEAPGNQNVAESN